VQPLTLRVLFVLGNLTAADPDARLAVFEQTGRAAFLFSLLETFVAEDQAAAASSAAGLGGPVKGSARPDSPGAGEPVRPSADLLAKVTRSCVIVCVRVCVCVCVFVCLFVCLSCRVPLHSLGLRTLFGALTWPHCRAAAAPHR
jgi:hypothetical protein